MDKQTIREVLRDKNYNLSQAARALGMDYNDLRREHSIKIEDIVKPKYPMPADISTLGKPGMQRFVIAVKANATVWPQQFYNAIQKARENYDKGTHEMCQQKRKDGWVVLYSIPRRQPRTRRARYFAFPWGNGA